MVRGETRVTRLDCHDDFYMSDSRETALGLACIIVTWHRLP